MWSDTTQQVRQVNNIGRHIAQKLAQGGMGGLRALADADPRRIEQVAGKAYPFGNTTKASERKIGPDLETSPWVESTVQLHMGGLGLWLAVSSSWAVHLHFSS